jgi:hypothetical protein
MAIYQDGIEEFTQIANFVLSCTDAARCLRPTLSSVSLLVAFGIGTRLDAERDTDAALRVSRDRRVGVAVGLWFERDGGAHSPTLDLVRALGIPNRTEIGDRVD